MSGKSIFLSILAVILFGGVVFALIMLFKTQALFVLPGLLLFIIPVAVRNKAMDASRGKADEFIAKILVPILAVLIAFLAIMAIAFWINM